MNRSENTLYDCEVEGDIPDDLDGAFYRVGPDAQYPKPAGLEYDIGFDGEGHASAFHISKSHVDYTSRWVKNPRWKAQHEARRSLFGVYRNRFSDDPSVRNVSRATQNTQVWYHNGRVLAMKEDSMPAALDPRTLDTLDADYRFDGGVKGETFTAHPKNCSHTGNLIAFGYEAKGLGSRDIEVFEITPQGKTVVVRVGAGPLHQRDPRLGGHGKARDLPGVSARVHRRRHAYARAGSTGAGIPRRTPTSA